MVLLSQPGGLVDVCFTLSETKLLETVDKLLSVIQQCNCCLYIMFDYVDDYVYCLEMWVFCTETSETERHLSEVARMRSKWAKIKSRCLLTIHDNG